MNVSMPMTRSSKRRKTRHDNPKPPAASMIQNTSPEGSEDSFKYVPLNPNGDSIRLLRILPMRRFDGIDCGVECEIFHTNLTKELDYEALSYVWGDRAELQSITLEGRPFNVTENLYCALRELQKSQGQKPIWIDAVCINQGDAKERSEQVRKMGRIFSSATRVVAWLGPADEESKNAISLIQVLKRSIEDRAQTRITIRDPQYLNYFFGLYKLYYRDYWWRVWVIQEVALAKSSITIFCGSDQLAWSCLVKVQETLAEHHLHDIDFIAHDREELSFLRVTIESPGPRALLLPATAISGAPDLSQILLKHRFKASTDPKDKVYSLIGLSNARDDPRFVLDYSRSVREVYIDLVSYVASSLKKLDIICAMPRWPSPHGLPSWTPDWSFEGLGSSLLNESFEHQYSAAGQRQANNAVFSDGVLSVRGVCIDTVALVGGPSNMADLEDESNALRAFFDWYKLFVPDDSNKAIAQEAFCRTMLRDKVDPKDYEGWSKPDFLRRTFGAFVRSSRSIFPALELDPDLDDLPSPRFTDVIGARLVKETREMTFGRRFVTTASRFPGLVPDTTVKGDVICVIFGCQLPVVLRQEGGHYNFLGEAYVDGYMYGLVLEDLKARRKEEIQFEIH